MGWLRGYNSTSRLLQPRAVKRWEELLEIQIETPFVLIIPGRRAGGGSEAIEPNHRNSM